MRTPTRTWLWALSCALLFGAACDERREAGTGPVDASAAAVGVDAGTRPAALAVTEYVRDAGAASLAEPAPNLGGEVIDLYDERVVGARVTCAGAQVRTGEDGRYALPCAPGHKVFAQAVGYDAVEARAPGLVTVRQLALRLQAAGTIGGSAITTEGAALADVHVELAGSGVWPPRRTTTDGHGRFAFASVPEGIYELRASRPAQANPAALASAIKREVAVEGPGGAATADLVLSPAGELVGRVADGDGRGLAAVRLSLADSALPLLGDGTVSDDRGAFRFGPLAPGLYRLRAEARTLWQDAPAEVLVGAGTTTFHLSVASGARIEGRALSAEGEPVSGARVAVRHGEHGTLTSLHRRKSRVRVFAARTGARGLDAEDAAANATSTDAA